MEPYIYLYTLIVIALVISIFFTEYLKNKEPRLSIDISKDTHFYGNSVKNKSLSRLSKKYITYTKYNNIIFKIVFIILTLYVATRRGSVGTDTQSYIDFFNHSHFYYNGAPTDIGFEMLGRILHVISSNGNFFICVCGLISMMSIYILIDRLSKDKVLSVFMFCCVATVFNFFFLYLSMVRQSVSLTFLFMSFYLLFEKKKIKTSIILYLISISIHMSSLVSLPLILLLYYKNINKRIWFIAIVITYIMAGLNISVVNDVLSYIFGFLGDTTGHYAGYEDANFGWIEAKGFYNAFIVPFNVFGLYMLYFSTNKQLQDWKNKMFLISVVTSNIFFDNLMWGRLLLCFTMFSMIAIPNILYRKSLLHKLIFLLIFGSYYLLRSFRELSTNLFTEGNIIVPYTSWFLPF